MDKNNQMPAIKQEDGKLVIEVPEGYVIDTEASTSNIIRLKEEKGSDLPNTWEEYCKYYPPKTYKKYKYFISSTSSVHKVVFSSNGTPKEMDPVLNRNMVDSEGEAEAFLALMQLTSLRDCYNDGWIPNWKDDSDKYVIDYEYEELHVETRHACSAILSFKTAELRDKFFKNFKDLIKMAKPLL